MKIIFIVLWFVSAILLGHHAGNKEWSKQKFLFALMIMEVSEFIIF